MTSTRLTVALRPSRIYAAGLWAAHLATYTVLLWAPLSRRTQVLVLALVILLGLRAWRYWTELAQWQGLILADEGVQLLGVRGSLDASLSPGFLLGRWLVILPLVTGSGVRRLPIFPDSAPPEDWRRLRVWLNTRAGARDVRQ
jgi:hypothetical protein